MLLAADVFASVSVLQLVHALMHCTHVLDSISLCSPSAAALPGRFQKCLLNECIFFMGWIIDHSAAINKITAVQKQPYPCKCVCYFLFG